MYMQVRSHCIYHILSMYFKVFLCSKPIMYTFQIKLRAFGKILDATFGMELMKDVDFSLRFLKIGQTYMCFFKYHPLIT